MTNKTKLRDIIIYQGETLAVLPELQDGSVDAIITDPPYSSGGLGMASRQKTSSDKYQSSGIKREYPLMLGDCKDQRSFTAWATLWLSECWRIAKDGAPILLFSDWRQLPAMTDALQGGGWQWLGIVTWNKRSSRPQMGKFRNQCEYILFGSKGRFKPATRTCLPSVYDFPVIASHKVHIAGKPVNLLKALMEIAPEKALILDPFIGGGSTALAALETGRKCIGIEISKEYAGLVKNRIEKYLDERSKNGGDLFPG